MNSSSRTVAWSVWIIASLFYAYQYILRVMPNIMLNDIIERFHMTPAVFGQFSGIYYIGYSLVHLPVGIMLDRYGVRKVMTGCILLTAVGTLTLLFEDHWLYPIVGRLLVGIGASAAILGLFKIIRFSFSEERFARMLSFSVMIGLIGAIYGGGPVDYMLTFLGYETVIKLFALLGLLLAGITYFVAPPEPAHVEVSVMANVREVLTNSKVIVSCLCAGLMVGCLEGFADVWAAIFFKQIYGFDGTLAASMPSMIYIGMCFGSPFLSFIAEKMRSYLAVIIGAGAFMGGFFSLILFAHLPSNVLSISLMIIGLCSAYQVLAIYKASTYVREGIAGLTTALANMIIMVFGYGFHAAIGFIVGAMGGKDAPVALLSGLSIIPVALVIGLLGFTWIFFSEKRRSIQALS